MKQSLAAVIVLVLGVFLCAGTAHAQTGGKGWLERLSGPGPFTGIRVDIRVVCFFEDSKGDLPDRKWFWQRGDVDGEGHPRSCLRDTNVKLRSYMSVEFDQLSSQENSLFPVGTSASTKVKLFSVKPALMFRMSPAVDVGVGFGLNWFSGGAFRTFHRASVQPIRVVFTPLSVFNPSNARLRSLRIPVESNLFRGRFTSERFGAHGAFTARGEWLWSTALVIDVWTLFVSGS